MSCYSEEKHYTEWCPLGKKFGKGSKTHFVVVMEWSVHETKIELPYDSCTFIKKNFNGGLLEQRQFLKVLFMYKNIKHFSHPHLKHIVFQCS